ncbi:glutamyl aminopeptidase [Streptococcus danieliae]|uniref:Glutamyl aminopeptidase n=1 Tax=Streptococcus danieliae TaxID=747656 RepID=A0A7Z0RRE6_9STRE|nr:glutamyl aminopeptidase [Streptococcus danieliae]MBF0717128.1 glutamyl aminopeptidase [Streptococcus danieliae]NYS49058.1 glutamyl aminopeptidase [Streptococcus danieliae]
MNQLFQNIQEVTQLKGISGHEGAVRSYLRNQLQGSVDQIQTDGLGSIFGLKKSQAADAPRVLVAAHMDEVGFMVSSIKDDGTFRAVEIGGWNPLVVSGQRYTLITRQGQEIPLITAATPPHLLRASGSQASLPAISDVIFDAGFTDKAEAEAFGIRPGDTIVPDSQTILTANGKNVISKAWDNRYGILMIKEAAQALASEAFDYDLYLGANVQEEVGLRGAHTSTTLLDPSLFFAVDCSPAADVFGGQGKIGEGTLIRFYDPGHLLLPAMKDFLLDTAESAGIKYQYYAGAGGTDAGAAHLKNGGVPSTTIGVCARYIHSHQTLYSLDDFLEAQAFLQALLKNLDQATIATITGYQD